VARKSAPDTATAAAVPARQAIAPRSRIVLREPTAADQREFLESVRRSGTLHRPWCSAPATLTEYRAWLARCAQPANRGLLVCRRDSGRIVGVINITNIVFGLFRSAFLGYYAFAGFERQGLMREGLQGAVRHAFTSLKLHRLEANIQPGNAASIALARTCGFSKEGYSPRYLKIGGRWRDHERWAIRAS
jgi:ribosomal-protein-alanine N-acetyltransferase